jgi:hypothetical protein
MHTTATAEAIDHGRRRLLGAATGIVVASAASSRTTGKCEAERRERVAD